MTGSASPSPEQAPAPYAAQLREILAALPPQPQDDAFYEGHCVVQHDTDVAYSALKALLSLIEEVTQTRLAPPEGMDHWLKHQAEGQVRPAELWGVYEQISSTAHEPLARAWQRLISIDWTTMYEYGQAYFALYPATAPINRQEAL